MPDRHPADDAPVVPFADAAAFEAHGASEHFQRLGVGDAIPRLESRERTFYETVDL